MEEQICNVNATNIYSLINNKLKSFCLSLYIRAGSLYESPTENGISHLFEHIVFRNLKNKYENFYELLASHGLELLGITYKEFIRFTINGPSEEFEFASDILCSLFAEIDLPKLEFDKEKRRIKAEIREKDERSSLDFCFNKLVWKDTEAEKTVLGYCKVIDGISIKKINEFRKKSFCENNFFVYITGNALQDDINKLYKKISVLDIQKSDFINANLITANKEFFNRNCAVNVKDDQWNYIKIGFDIDTFKYSNGLADFLYAILFKGDKALVHKYLSEENPIIYSYDCALEQYDNIGNINFKFEVDKLKQEEAISFVVKILNDIKLGCFDFEANLQSELYYTKMELDKPDDLNWSMAYYNHILKTRPFDYSSKCYGRFNFTKEEVTNAAKEIFKVCNMTIAIKGNKKKINAKNIEDILKTLDI